MTRLLRFIGGIVLTIALLTAMGLSLLACLWLLLPKAGQ